MRELYQKEGGKFPDPILNLTWSYTNPTNPSLAEVAKEINGKALADLKDPNTGQEINFFIDCIESLLDREADMGGFRGVQSKSLVDIIQLECLSQSSSVLKITNGTLAGKVWFKNGDLIDAATQELAQQNKLPKQ